MASFVSVAYANDKDFIIKNLFNTSTIKPKFEYIDNPSDNNLLAQTGWTVNDCEKLHMGTTCYTRSNQIIKIEWIPAGPMGGRIVHLELLKQTSNSRIQFQPLIGIEYYYYDDNSGKDTDTKKRLTSDEYKFLCENTKGVTKYMSRTPGLGNSDYGYLIENGDFDGWEVTYNSAYDKKECRIKMTASGFMRGNSRRVTVNGYVLVFVVNENGQILAHWGTAY